MSIKVYGERINRVLNYLQELGASPMVSKQVMRHIYRSNVNEFAKMNEVPIQTRAKLAEKFGPTFLSLTSKSSSSADSANKVLFECQDGEKIEGVSLAFKNHTSLCISSQSGCAFKCSFCETGKIGFKRHLSVSEICDQVHYFNGKGDVNSISFMGMGEPLSNPRVFDSISALTNKIQFGLSPSRINVSTIGIIPGIRKLNDLHPKVNLTFSLHSPFPEQRAEMMPVEKAYRFLDVMELLDKRVEDTSNRVWLAYLLLEGVNDSQDHAKALVNLIRARPIASRYLYHVNLLPYNAGRSPNEAMKRVSDISKFQAVLSKAGISHSYRNSFGRPINAACGQLYAEYEAKTISSNRPA